MKLNPIIKGVRQDCAIVARRPHSRIRGAGVPALRQNTGGIGVWAMSAILVLWVFQGTGFSRDCGNCGSLGFPELVMVCPKCGMNLLAPQSRLVASATGVLVAEVMFSGDNPSRLPEFGKVYINDVYRGNLSLSAKEPRDAISGSRREGLGVEFTAIYKGEWRNLDIGQVRIRIDFKFKRAYGFARSFKSMTFPYVMMKSGEKTVLRYTFASARQFGRTGKDAESRQLPGKGGPHLIIGTGTIGIDLPAVR